MTDESLTEVLDRLADDDELVLQCVDQGLDDVNLITQATQLNRNKVHHRFRKLAGELGYFDLQLIEYKREEGMVEREVNGVRQVFETPKKAELTELGYRVVEELGEKHLKKYRSMSRDELAARMVELEQEVDDLTRSFRIFKEQVQEYIFES